MAKGDALHEEVWDDSELVTSWNEALEEYKKYHSLAARGEKVNVVLDQAENGEYEDPATTTTAKQTSQPLPVNGETSTTSQQSQVNGGAEAPAQPPMAGMPVPQVLLNSVQDEGMKNLMMSWYYAGYYTGLYEGQQKAYASMQQAG